MFGLKEKIPVINETPENSTRAIQYVEDDSKISIEMIIIDEG